jgi:nucleotide sugar dehydrogenase
MHVGIVGYGVVGRALARMFRRSDAHQVHIYDRNIQEHSSPRDLAAVDQSDIAFIAVPTPYDNERHSCDISIVTEMVRQISAPICIKSTVPPGTTDDLTHQTGKSIAFSPEYVGESLGHPWPEVYDCGFVILGGNATACARTRQAYESVSPLPLNFVETSATLAELVKYMENSFLATKVSFMNQFFDLASAARVDFAELRKLFLLDGRVGSSHSIVTCERGFGGKCLPKDLRSIIAWSWPAGGAPLLEAVLRYNDTVRSASGEDSLAADVPEACLQLIGEHHKGERA